VEDGYIPSPLIAAIAIARASKKAELGTAISLAPFYHPVRFAEDCAVLDILSNGRVEPGLGLGYAPDEFAAYGVPARTLIAMKYEVRAMLRAGGGSIVNISSTSGTTGVPFTAPYAASWHGVNGLTKTAANALARQSLRVNAIAPGGVMTELLRIGPATDEAAFEKSRATIPIGRLGTTEEIANAAVWLASDLSSYVTGTIPVDGALTVS
jgi:NAD(P)-dependent dehydrogenase (short-subunit alcohol dehydrogenase family)